MMNTKHLVGALFVLAVLTLAAGYPALMSPENAAPSPVVQPAPAPIEHAICSSEGTQRGIELPGSAELEEVVCSRCPDGSPQCWSDKQCDSFCGGKGFGSCTRINSCYKCCLCAL